MEQPKAHVLRVSHVTATESARMMEVGPHGRCLVVLRAQMYVKDSFENVIRLLLEVALIDALQTQMET